MRDTVKEVMRSGEFYPRYGSRNRFAPIDHGNGPGRCSR